MFAVPSAPVDVMFEVDVESSAKLATLASSVVFAVVPIVTVLAPLEAVPILIELVPAVAPVPRFNTLVPEFPVATLTSLTPAAPVPMLIFPVVNAVLVPKFKVPAVSFAPTLIDPDVTSAPIAIVPVVISLHRSAAESIAGALISRIVGATIVVIAFVCPILIFVTLVPVAAMFTVPV